MLKLNNTDVGLYMEQIMINPELLMQERVFLAMRLGQTLYVEPGRASLKKSCSTGLTTYTTFIV